MTVYLSPMNEHQFGVYLEDIRHSYASSLTDGDSRLALEKSRRAIDTVLIDGYRTPGQFFYNIMNGDDIVGGIWAGRETIKDEPAAFLYDININEHSRGQGFSKQAIGELAKALRDIARVDRLYLNVFDTNSKARKLYDGTGFEVYQRSPSGKGTIMVKSLQPS